MAMNWQMNGTFNLLSIFLFFSSSGCSANQREKVYTKPRLRFMSSYLISAPPMMICGIRTSGTMFAAVFGAATSDEITSPSATPPIAVMNMIPR